MDSSRGTVQVSTMSKLLNFHLFFVRVLSTHCVSVFNYCAIHLDFNIDRSRQQHKLGKEKLVDGEKIRYVCPVCKKSYGSTNGFKYHARFGHGPKSTYTCDVCNKVYESRHGIRAHKRNHEIRRAAEALEAERLRQLRQ